MRKLFPIAALAVSVAVLVAVGVVLASRSGGDPQPSRPLSSTERWERAHVIGYTVPAEFERDLEKADDLSGMLAHNLSEVAPDLDRGEVRVVCVPLTVGLYPCDVRDDATNSALGAVMLNLGSDNGRTVRIAQQVDPRALEAPSWTTLTASAP